MLKSNWLAFLITLIISVVWLRIVDFFAHKGFISAGLSRKIIHIGTGPIFVLCWLLFNDSQNARYFAAVVPLLITLQFALIGLGVIKDQPAVDAMSRSGNPKEILKGPLYYGIIFVIITTFIWKDQPVGIIALMMLCGGDGMADLIGRAYGKVKLPWSKNKSYAGSLTVLISGFLLSFLVIGIYSVFVISFRPMSGHLLPVAVIALTATIVESIPVKDIDNLTVPLASILMGLLLYG